MLWDKNHVERTKSRKLRLRKEKLAALKEKNRMT